MDTVTRPDSPGLICHESLVSLAREFLGDYPNPDYPQEPGPWDPVVAAAITRTARQMRTTVVREGGGLVHHIAASRPAIWDIFGGGPESWVALNPQPLPPGNALATALADELMDRAVHAQEMADWLAPPGERQGIIIVGGRLQRYVDEYCGNDFRIRFPMPVPPPPWWRDRLSATDLIAMGIRFTGAAGRVGHEGLGGVFTAAGEALIGRGLARIG